MGLLMGLQVSRSGGGWNARDVRGARRLTVRVVRRDRRRQTVRVGSRLTRWGVPIIMQGRWHVGTWGGRTMHLQLGSRGGVLRWEGLHAGEGQVTDRVLRWEGLHTGGGQVTDRVL